VTFTATVSPQLSGTPAGSVSFYDGTTLLKSVSESGGEAKFTTKTLTSGTHTITATYGGSTSFDGGNSAALTQTVNIVPTLTSIAVAPANSALGVGATEQFTAYGSYSDGSVQDITSSVTWKSSTIHVATIASGGLAAGVATGTTTITAASGPVSGNAVLTVN
jgi:trimeric autotransporter adhesin